MTLTTDAMLVPGGTSEKALRNMEVALPVWVLWPGQLAQGAGTPGPATSSCLPPPVLVCRRPNNEFTENRPGSHRREPSAPGRSPCRGGAVVGTLVGSLALPVSIFAAEMCVVTLGTVRIIFIARGLKRLAPLLGFFEVTIWLFAISQIMQNLASVPCYLAFAAGFTAGNYLGIHLERMLAIGTVVVRIITKPEAADLVEGLRAAEYGVTCLNGEGATGPVRVVLTVVKRRQLGEVVAIIKRCNPRAFYSVDELQAASEGIFPSARTRTGTLLPIPTGLLAWVGRRG
jgi:uncharacterized protein YebE (UPF0316 family)